MNCYKSFLKEQVNRKQAPIYVPIRYLTTPISWFLSKKGVSPNLLTAIGCASAILGAISISTGHHNGLFFGAFLVFVAYLFDCMDGEVARARGISSKFGSQLDQLSNWVTLISLQIGLAIGAYKLTADAQVLVWGMFAVAGWCTFYYLYLQMVLWISCDAGFTLLRRLSGFLFFLMPLDENLVIVFAILQRPDIGIMVSAVIATMLPISVCVLFIVYQSHYQKCKVLK